MNFDHWCSWLLYSSLFFMAFGVFVAIAPNSFLISPWTNAVDARFFPGETPPDAVALRAFLMAPLGATIAGTYLLQTFVVIHGFRKRENWAWHAILYSTLLWFGVDSMMSVVHGAYFNIAMINLAPLVVFGIPLLATRSALSGGEK